MRSYVFLGLLLISAVTLFGGWIAPAKEDAPSSYEAIDRSVITKYMSLFSNEEILFRKGNYLSLRNSARHTVDILTAGTILFFRTDQGHYGKMKLTGYVADYARTEKIIRAFCDIPVFLFTTYRADGSILISGSKPDVIEEGEDFSNCCTLKGVEDPDSVFLLESLDLGSWDYPERPGNGSFMWFHFDFDTNETSINPEKFPKSFTGADLYNIKTETYSRLIPKNGAVFLVVYQP